MGAGRAALRVSAVADPPRFPSLKPGVALLVCSWGLLWKLVNKFKAVGSVTGVQEWVALCGDEMLFKLFNIVRASRTTLQYFPFHPCWEGGRNVSNMTGL